MINTDLSLTESWWDRPPSACPAGRTVRGRWRPPPSHRAPGSFSPGPPAWTPRSFSSAGGWPGRTLAAVPRSPWGEMKIKEYFCWKYAKYWAFSDGKTKWDSVWLTAVYSRIGEGALWDGDLVDLVLTGGQTRHPRPVVLRLLDVVVLPQLAEHFVHAEEGGAFAERPVLQDRGQVHHPPVIVGGAPTPVQHLVIGGLEQTVADIISGYQTIRTNSLYGK